MNMLILILIGPLFVVIALLTIVLTKTLSRKNLFDVFDFSTEGRLTVLTGLPVTYDLSAIEKVFFSVMKSRKGMNYTGRFKILFANGSKSRPFLFDYSVCTKKFTLINTKEDIEKAAHYLMNQLKQHHIPAYFAE